MEIEKGMKPKKTGCGTYPFDEMDIGDAFAVVGCTEKTRTTVLASFRYYSLRYKVVDRKMVSRKEDGLMRFYMVDIKD